MDEIDAFLAKHGIGFEKYEHPPVYTTAEAKLHTGHLPGGHVKNLFLRNKDGSHFYLLVIHESKRADLSALAKNLGETKLSFGSPEKLMDLLGVTPGSVSPLGLIFDRQNTLTILIDKDLWDYQTLYFHPNRNTLTYGITSDDFRTFLSVCKNPLLPIDLPLRA